MYFSLYPKVAYKIDDYDYIKSIDITTAITLKNYIKNYRSILYNPYIIKDGERPDNVSKRFYGDTKYAWIVLLVNEIFNIYDEWPRSVNELNEYVEQKYGSIEYATSAIKNYYDLLGNVIDQTTYNSLSATARSSESYYEYEMKINDAKSRIKIVSPAFITTIETDVIALLKQ